MRAAAPAAITTFVGRRRELLAVERFMSSARFVTLVGPGGCGKTRLAAELARRSKASEIAWISLAQLRRPEDVRREVARRAAQQWTSERNGRVLMVLDNCEHVLEPAAELAVQMLSEHPRARVLATSREPLDVEGELVWRVPSLSLPEHRYREDPQECARADSVRLFVERARLAQPDFVLDATTCPHAVAICRAVDGIPLAIELAAARLRYVSIDELAKRLDDLVGLLVGTRRAGEPRHRTLAIALDWSHALLSERQRRVLRRVAVFAGGFALDGAEAVCVDRPDERREVLADVGALVDKSLLAPPAPLQRYRMLEPVREYAFELLRTNGEVGVVTERCARYLVDLVTTTLRDPMGMGSAEAIERASAELPNLVAIAPWLIEHDAKAAVSVLARFTQNHWGLSATHMAAVTELLGRALERHVARDRTRVEGLLGLIQVVLRGRVGPELVEARRLADEAISISEDLDDESYVARARARSAFVSAWREPERALRELDEAIPTLRRMHLGALALSLASRAVLRQSAGDAGGADADVAESFEAWERHAGSSNLSRALTLVAAADVAFQRCERERATALLREAVAVEQDAHRAAPAFLGSVVSPIEFLAHLAALRGEADVALQLAGYAGRMFEETGVWPREWFALTPRAWLDELMARDAARARRMLAVGRRLSGSEAATLALGIEPRPSLSARELAVGELVANGLSDKEIASRLAISHRTAESHVQRIREKLHLRSRAQIGRWIAENLASSPDTHSTRAAT